MYRRRRIALLLALLAAGAVAYALLAREEGASRVAPIASLTKMMTALLVAERVPRRGRVRITPATLRYSGSGVGLLPRGKLIGVQTMLHGLLLVSGNDAAIALAQRAAGGSQRSFVRLMNRCAQAMGLACTHFSTPSGIRD